ncbi:hypothetical protein [Massilia sp. SYSU DXS3249]
MQTRKRTYKALVWKPEPGVAGKRVTVFADSLEQARRKLEEEHGQGSVFDLHDDEPDAAAPRPG